MVSAADGSNYSMPSDNEFDGLAVRGVPAQKVRSAALAGMDRFNQCMAAVKVIFQSWAYAFAAYRAGNVARRPRSAQQARGLRLRSVVFRVRLCLVGNRRRGEGAVFFDHERTQEDYLRFFRMEDKQALWWGGGVANKLSVSAPSAGLGRC